MANDEPIGEIQERMRGAGLLLLELSENTDAVENLRGSIDNDDLRHFRSTLFNAVGELPPDRCNPYVQVIIKILKPPKLVRRCEWVPRLVDPNEAKQIAEALHGGIDSEAFTDLLESLGLIRCRLEPEDQSEIIVADKFAQGICPPGSF